MNRLRQLYSRLADEMCYWYITFIMWMCGSKEIEEEQAAEEEWYVGDDPDSAWEIQESYKREVDRVRTSSPTSFDETQKQ